MCAVGLKRRRTFSPFFDCTGRRCAFCVPKIACQAQNAVALTIMLLYGKVVSGNVHLARYYAPPRSVGVRCAGVFGNVPGNAGQKGGYRKRARGKNCVGRKYVRRRKISAGAGARCGAEKRQKAVVIGRARLQAFEARPTSFNYSPRLIPIICPARFSVTRVFRHPPRVIFSPRFAWFSHPPRLHLIQYFNVRFPLSAPRILGHPSACRYRFA